MPDLKKFIKNRSAVSEVMGEVLLTSIAVLLVSFIAIFISTYDGATDVPHTQVKEWMDAGSDKIYLEHSGGEFLETDALEIVASVNGERYVYSSDDIYANLGSRSSWQLGDIIEIDTKSEWNVSIGDRDEIKVFLIDTPSRQVIQHLTLSLGETGIAGNWVTPQGEVKDHSGGFATPLDVFEENDNLRTIYYPPEGPGDSTSQEFNFASPSTLWGIDKGGNVTAVNLSIVYKVNGNSCKDIILRIWDEDPSETWHEESLPEYDTYTAHFVDLSAYINNTVDVENLIVEISATKNESERNDLNVDYIALQVS